MNWQEPASSYLSSFGEIFSHLPDSLSTLEMRDIAIILVALVFLVQLIRTLRKPGGHRQTRQRANRRAGSTNFGDKPAMADPHWQMEAVNQVQFEVKKLLNSKEARLLPILEDTVHNIGKGHRVMAQTSMGELLRPKPGSGTWKERKDAFASINSKRFDFAVIDRWGKLVCAIEYQGDGHHQGKAFMRDAVKREVVRKAGVAWIEVMPGDKPSDLRRQVLKILADSPEPAQKNATSRQAESS